jgi:hypothetical protein
MKKPTKAELIAARKELREAKKRPTVWVNGREYYALWPSTR